MHDSQEITDMIVRVVCAVILLAQIGKFKLKYPMKYFFVQDLIIAENLVIMVDLVFL